MAKNDSAISMDDILKDRACPDCNLMMTKGFISARNMRGGIIWDSTSPDMYEGYYVGKPKLGIGKGKFSSTPAYHCSNCNLLLVNQEIQKYEYTKTVYKTKEIQEWPDIDKLRERLRSPRCPECDNLIANENFCPSCGFDLKPHQEAM